MKTTLPVLPVTIASEPPPSKTPLRDAARRKVAEWKAAKAKFGGVDVDGTTSEIYLDGDVGDAFNARDVREALKKLDGRKAKIFINSRGGTVTEGFAIFNALAEYPGGCDTYCTFAASIASLIFQSGERRYMFPASLMMVHSPWTSNMSGNASQLQREIEVLEKFQEAMVSTYSRRTGKSQAAITKLLQSETWMTDSEAISEGFADAVVGSEYAARTSMSIAELRAKLTRLDRLPKIDPTPLLNKYRSRMAKLKVKTDQIMRLYEKLDHSEW